MHSHREVGFDIGIIIGLSVFDAIILMRSSVKMLGEADRPSSTCGLKVLIVSSRDDPSGTTSFTHARVMSLI